jgi:hypothetical protein
MNTDWLELAERYSRLSTSIPIGDAAHTIHEEINSLIGLAASRFPRDKSPDLEWHIRALEHPSHKWFVTKVVGRLSPLPSTLFDPLLTAALREANPSATQFWVNSCVKAFGGNAVLARSEQLAKLHEHGDTGLANIRYWVPRC